jgi:predicted nucleic acid-binding protein
VPEVWIANASPVILLAKAGYLRLLKELPSELLLPSAVVNEILVGPDGDPARRAVEEGWAAPTVVSEIPADLIEWNLGPGETAVLALARTTTSSTAVLDDAPARACAQTLAVPLIGTLGVVLRAKKRNLISQAADVMRALVSAGIHLDNRTIGLALSRIGEKWSEN